MFIFVVDTSTEGPDENANLLHSSMLGRLIFNYQVLQYSLENTTIGWFYSENSVSAPCVVSGYQVDIYANNEIETKIQRNVIALRTLSTSQNFITLASHLLKDSSNNAEISVAQNENSNCATSAYYHNLVLNG